MCKEPSLFYDLIGFKLSKYLLWQNFKLINGFTLLIVIDFSELT